MTQTTEKKIPAIVVVGPTASGKTALAVALAKTFNGEVISADSMQIYRGMRVATAKPTAEEMQGVPHHMTDFLPVSARYSVAAFVEAAKQCAEDINARGKTVIVAGGTGLYVDSLIDNLLFEAEADPGALRERLSARRAAEGIGPLYAELQAADPEYAAQVDPRNEKRVLRALEILYLTGERPSERRARALTGESLFAPVFIGLCYRDRELLYRRIALRVDKMLAEGLLEEARAYFALDGACTASQAIGYKEFAPYLRGKESFETARENLIRATRRYAKRQMTWFRRNPRIHWIDCDGLDGEALLLAAEAIVRRSQILEGK